MGMYLRFLTQKVPLSYLFVCLFSGLSGGFFYPLLGIYVVDGLGSSPIQMGLFLALSILSGVLVSQKMAKLSDKNGERRNIILGSQCAFILVMILFTFIRNYYLALFVMVTISSFSAAAMPQTYTLGREYADSELKERATLFISFMRAMMSLSWVIGPPLAFIIYGKYGFNGAFIFAASSMLFSVFIVWRMFPSQKRNLSNHGVSDDAVSTAAVSDDAVSTAALNHMISWQKIPGVPLYLCALFMLFWANSMYVTSMPLYVTKELKLSGEIAGQLMGLAAFIEIPIMVVAAFWATKISPNKLMVLGAGCACLFYAFLFYSDALWQMYVLQLFNGLAVGITASLGMVIIQNKMSRQMGMATTLFNNAMMLSTLMSSITVGLIAQLRDYHSVIFAMILGSLGAFVLLFLSSREKKASSPSDPSLA